MGSGQSIFYPDNPKRRDRAQQLADDCTNFSNMWKQKRADLDTKLGSYKQKLDKVLTAFGCQTIHDLDAVVQKMATGKALESWNSTKDVYDKTQVVDQVIMGAMGVVAISGFAVSSVGALAGGFGFFAGLAVTGDILLALGIIGVIFDIINGAIQRGKLRDSINRLFTNRLKCKQALAHIDNLYVWLPTIKDIYQTYEDLHYSPEKIIQRLKDKGVMKPLKADLASETFSKAASDLHAMDVKRGSWTSEDPNWVSTANALDAATPLAMASRLVIVPNSTNSAQTHFSKASINIDESPPYDEYIKISVASSDSVPAALDGVLDIGLHSLLDDVSAEVIIRTDPGQLLGLNNGYVDEVSTFVEAVYWTIAFANPADAAHFTHNAPFNPEDVSVRFILGAKVAETLMYVGKNGALVDGRSKAEEFKGNYVL